MTGAEVVRARCLAIAALTALVGTRVRVAKLAQTETFPAVRVTSISRIEPMHLRGSVGILTERVQVDFYADEPAGDPYASATAVEAAAHGDFVGGQATGLNGFTGAVATTPATDVLAILPLDRREMYEAEERRRYIVSRDYAVTYRS